MVDINALADTLSQLTVVEAAQLVKVMEEKWGVQAQVRYVTPLRPIFVPPGDTAPVMYTEYDLTLTKIDPTQKIETIKTLRKFRPDLGLREAKESVESLPFIVVSACSGIEDTTVGAALRACGATVEMIARS